MKLSEIKKLLAAVETVNFKLPSGEFVPENFHVTEVGLVTKHFVDCGNAERVEKAANFQLWNANDTEHRLKPQKLLKIIEISRRVLGDEDLEIEVEYQTETVGKYDLGFDGENFQLLAKNTACLAQEVCCAPTQKPKIRLSDLQIQSCAPNSDCC